MKKLADEKLVELGMIYMKSIRKKNEEKFLYVLGAVEKD
jgi:hypothetical protein